MKRAAAMFSMFSQLDTKRKFGMQRFDSEYEIIISIKAPEDDPVHSSQ